MIPVTSYGKVYPRTHGETEVWASKRDQAPGLSPYTRGNPVKYEIKFTGKGSIPVHTGKPRWTPRTAIINKVYPRTHGETSQPPAHSIYSLGLSPYTRGNHCPAADYITTSQVYPRTHGETLLVWAAAVAVAGLSPYTRGNLYKRILLLTP